MQVEIPTVNCEEVTEERCVSLPSLQEDQVEAQQCTVAVGGQTCREVSTEQSTLSSSHHETFYLDGAGPTSPGLQGAALR